MSPGKTQAYLNRFDNTIWFGDQVCIAEDRLAEPFDFVSGDWAGGRCRVP